MQVATIVRSKLNQKQLIMIGAAILIPILVAVAIGGFFLIQSSSTQASEDAPANISIQTPDAQTAQIAWQTAQEAIAMIEYGTSPDALTEAAFSELETTDHLVQIPNLEPSTTYYFRIRIGDQVFDEGGNPWSFSTPSPTTEVGTDPIPSLAIGTTSAELTPRTTPSVLTPSPTPNTTLTPSVSLTLSPAPTSLTPTSLTPTSSTASSVCTATNCTSILSYLGTQCRTQDYVQCLMKASAAISTTPTPTPLSSALKAQCKVDYLQPNSCTSWNWQDVKNKAQVCADTFPSYFVQCKSTSWTSTSTATWYCNEKMSESELTLPCKSAPTPGAGQDVYCRVRAETEAGGDTDATDWVYTSTSCPRLTDDEADCSIDYIQGNSCTSWIWDLSYQKDPRCKDKFDHYFLQCTDDGNFDSSSFWHCNMTTENHYLDLPCYNAAIPGDGMPITCRVRAEDDYGVDNHVTSWVSGSAICPTSTPTPTPTPTPTDTPTPTP